MIIRAHRNHRVGSSAADSASPPWAMFGRHGPSSGESHGGPRRTQTYQRGLRAWDARCWSLLRPVSHHGDPHADGFAVSHLAIPAGSNAFRLAAPSQPRFRSQSLAFDILRTAPELEYHTPMLKWPWMRPLGSQQFANCQKGKEINHESAARAMPCNLAMGPKKTVGTSIGRIGDHRRPNR
jgi:hypothetical protein